MTKKEMSEEKLINKINHINEKIKEVKHEPIEKITNNKTPKKKTSAAKPTKAVMAKVSKKEVVEEPLTELKETKHETAKPIFGLFECIVFIVAFAIIFCLIGYMVGNHSKKHGADDYTVANKEVQAFIEQYQYILENYYGDIDKEELIKKAIDGMLSSLDDYSGFVGEESNSFNITLKGSYEGLGIEIANDLSEDIIVRKVYEDTPASKVGLKVNDIIVECDGISMQGKSSNELVDMISKKEKVTLKVKRDEKTFDTTIAKEEIILSSVTSEMLDNHIGYISISIFAENTYAQFKKALEELENNGMEKLIIDVRNNGGGYLTTADSIISLFMDASHVIYQTEDKEKVEKFYSKGAVNKEYPIVILQNGASASASEVLTSALQEQLNAYVVGDVSFGKGTVQQLQKVSGIGQYKFTTKKWLTSKGTWINKVGITPNYSISLEVDDFTSLTKEEDKQLQAGINYLKEH